MKKIATKIKDFDPLILPVIGPSYKVTFTWIDFGEGPACGWCKKLEKDIRLPIQHIGTHAIFDFLTDYYSGKENIFNNAIDS